MTNKELARFLPKFHVDEVTGCWLWDASNTKDGYGQFRQGDKMRRAHRVSYEHFIGSIPPGADLAHAICETRACVCPDHTAPSTSRMNTLDGQGNAAKNASKEFCSKCGGNYSYVKRTSRAKGYERRCAPCHRTRQTTPEYRDYQRDYQRARRAKLKSLLAHTLNLFFDAA